MKYNTENICICFVCFVLGYLFCQNMMGTEGLRDFSGNEDHNLRPGKETPICDGPCPYDDTSGHRNPDRGCWDPKSGLPMESPLQHVC